MRIHRLLFILAILSAVACSQHGAEKKSHEHETDIVSPGKETTTTTLTLNAGKKWKLDEATRQNIKLIREDFERAESGSPDYTVLAADLQAKSNKLVSECKMSGRDHDMLHIWLTDYLSSLKEMSSGDPLAQKNGFRDIEGQLRLFDQYFE